MPVERRKPLTANVGIFGIGHHAEAIKAVGEMLGIESVIVKAD